MKLHQSYAFYPEPGNLLCITDHTKTEFRTNLITFQGTDYESGCDFRISFKSGEAKFNELLRELADTYAATMKGRGE